MHDVVRIPGEEVVVYTVDIPVSERSSYRETSQRRKKGKQALCKAATEDNMVLLGRPKTRYSHTEMQKIQTFWCQAVPAKYFQKQEEGEEREMPYVRRAFILQVDNEQRLISCSCYFQPATIQTSQRAILEIAGFKTMTEDEALEAGWGKAEVYVNGTPIIWKCPECFAKESDCKHIWEMWHWGDIISVHGVAGTQAVKDMKVRDIVSPSGVVLEDFQLCSKCGEYEEVG